MPRAAKQPTPRPSPQGRAIVADPAAPGIPAQEGLPLVPPGYREATPFELWLWEAKADWLARGGVWSDTVRREMTDHYRAHTGDQA